MALGKNVNFPHLSWTMEIYGIMASLYFQSSVLPWNVVKMIFPEGKMSLLAILLGRMRLPSYTITISWPMYG